MTTAQKTKHTITDTGASARPISWTADIAHTRHRWWWYVVLVWLTFSATGIALALHAWTVAALIFVVGLALFIINIGKPRHWKMTVTKKLVIIERPDHPKFHYEIPLNYYRGFTVSDMPASWRDEPQLCIALLPTKWYGRQQLLVLPYDQHEAEMLIQQVSDLVPCEQGRSTGATDRTLSVLERWLGLS